MKIHDPAPSLQLTYLSATPAPNIQAWITQATFTGWICLTFDTSGLIEVGFLLNRGRRMALIVINRQGYLGPQRAGLIRGAVLVSYNVAKESVFSFFAPGNITSVQRRYSWTKEAADRLWEDLMAFMMIKTRNSTCSTP